MLNRAKKLPWLIGNFFLSRTTYSKMKDIEVLLRWPLEWSLSLSPIHSLTLSLSSLSPYLSLPLLLCVSLPLPTRKVLSLFLSGWVLKLPVKKANPPLRCEIGDDLMKRTFALKVKPNLTSTPSYRVDACNLTKKHL